METFRKQAERFGTEMHRRERDRGRLLASAPSASPPGTSTMHEAHRDHRHRRHRQAARAARRDASSWGGACRPAPPATASSSRTRTSWWWAAATPRWRRRSTSRASGARSRWCTAATRLRASKIMQERALKNPEDRVPLEQRGRRGHRRRRQGKVTGVRLRNLKTGARSETRGRRPVRRHRARAQHRALPGPARRSTTNDYIKVEPGTTRTSIAGVFAAGDVQDSRLPAGGDRRGHRAAWPRSRPSATSRRTTPSTETG